jgi:hypothetical protein
LINVHLKGFNQSFTWLLLQATVLSFLDNLAHFVFMAHQDALDFTDNFGFGNDICDTHSETSVYEPVVNDHLDVREDVTARLMA